MVKRKTKSIAIRLNERHRELLERLSVSRDTSMTRVIERALEMLARNDGLEGGPEKRWFDGKA